LSAVARAVVENALVQVSDQKRLDLFGFRPLDQVRPQIFGADRIRFFFLRFLR
jgi:hypothetical protein